MKYRAALIVDNLHIAKWQKSALDRAAENIEIVLILNCQNTKTKKNYFKHFFYYVFNFFLMKNQLTKKQKFKNANSVLMSFDSIYSGAWQSLPVDIYDSINKEKIDVIIKFGMNLLRIDDKYQALPILSYHHGDPSSYRGRPAGFYELINNEKTTGIIVQRLTNELDAGAILAFTESKIVSYSYKKTALNFYSNSSTLLNTAIINLFNKKYIDHSVSGKNYRLPSNLLVIKFLCLMLWRIILKISYGLFFEKKWKVGVAPNLLSLRGNEVIESSLIEEVPISNSYNFYADPFFSEDKKKIRLEALNLKTGLGDILEIDVDNFLNQKLLLNGKHYSYPFSFSYEGQEFLLPEVANHSAQFVCKADIPQQQISLIKGLENKRIVDATIFFKDGIYFLFFGEPNSAHTLLHLWYSNSPFGNFSVHPMSPIGISPKNARMGGKLLLSSDSLIRFGQDNSGEYGESLAVMSVISISKEIFNEEQIGTIKIDKFKGPHNIDFNSDMSKLLIDYYDDQFSIFAGVRRIKAKLSKS
jgi:hypothetical protein